MTEKTAKEKTIATQYAELHKLGQNGDYERALKAANKILGLSANEPLAFYCKIVCLIQLSKFEDAISQLNKNPEHLQKLIFEKAYCYYRLNKHEEALDTIGKSEEEIDYRIKELKAQILYRLEKFGEANSLYQEVIKNTDDDYEEERLTNLYATLVYMDPNEAKAYLDEVKENAYELCYNKACILISVGNFVEAEKKLKQCEKLCREKLEEDEDVTEEEVDVELALIRIQLAFVYQKQGRTKEAQQLYTSNLKIKLEDIALMAAASNNIVCINRDQNLFDSKKKMKNAVNDALLYKLPSVQRKFIALNNAILNYYLNQPDQCEKMCKNIQNAWPEFLTAITVLRALNLLKSEKLDDAITLLKSYPAKDKQERLYFNMCIAQFYLMQGKKLEACKLLENLGEDSYKPGIVGALTTLYLGMGDKKTALSVFQKTVEFYKKNKIKSADLTSLWRQAADFHIRNGHPEVAAHSLEELLVANKDDKKIVAQLVLACAQYDKSRALKLSRELPPVKELAQNVDLENLETLAPVNLKKSPAVRTDSQPGTPREDKTKTRKHKKRKGKLPKNYDSKIQPDPERWLPKYERTGYRKRKDRRTKQEVLKGSQGTSSGQAEQYDFSKFVEEGQDSPSSNSTVEPSPRGQGGKGQQQQKKAGQKKKNKRR